CEEEADCCTVVSVLFESRRDVSCRAKRAASSSRTRESSASVCSFVSRANIKASSSSNILDSSSALRDSNVDLVIFSSSMRNSRGPKNLLLRSPNEQSHRDRTVGKLKGKVSATSNQARGIRPFSAGGNPACETHGPINLTYCAGCIP
ncbi:hypothetical protein T265_14132, partial [Opisthorchis viverrini]